MFNLYVSKEEGKLEIKPLRKVFAHLINDITDEVKQYNHAYYFCAKRKPLLDLAQQLKQEWIEEIETELRRINNIQIK